MIRAKYALAFSILVLPVIAAATSVPLPYCVLSTPPGSITAGYPARLVWYSEGASGASIAGVGVVSVNPGYVDVYPRQNTTYTMTVSNAAGSRTCGALVTVVQPAPIVYYSTPIYTVPSAWYYDSLPAAKNYVTRTTYYDNWYSDYPSYGGYRDTSSPYYYSDPYVYTSPLDSEYSTLSTPSLSTMPSPVYIQDCASSLDCERPTVGGSVRELPPIPLPDNNGTSAFPPPEPQGSPTIVDWGDSSQDGISASYRPIQQASYDYGESGYLQSASFNPGSSDDAATFDYSNQ